MKPVRRTLALALLIALPGAAPSAAEGAARPGIEQLVFLSGTWTGDAFGGVVEERWSGLAGGSMVGSFRSLREGRLQMAEFMMIVEEDDGVVYRFKHYSTAMEPWEEEPLVFRLVAADGERAVFEGPDEQSPQSLTYERSGPGTLSVSVRTPDGGFDLELRRTGGDGPGREP